MFLQNAWHAVEYAGCNPYDVQGKVGVFALGAYSSYILKALEENPNIVSDNHYRAKYATVVSDGKETIFNENE